MLLYASYFPEDLNNKIRISNYSTLMLQVDLRNIGRSEVEK